MLYLCFSTAKLKLISGKMKMENCKQQNLSVIKHGQKFDWQKLSDKNPSFYVVFGLLPRVNHNGQTKSVAIWAGLGLHGCIG